MIFVYILIALAALYIIFIAAPAFFIYRFAFSRGKESLPLDKRDLKGTRYEPYSDRLLSAFYSLKALEYKKLSITARDGVELFADYFDNGSDKTAVFVHGYRGEPISNFCLQARLLCDMGFNLLFIHQRAHGESGGKRLGLGCAEQHDLLAWVELAENMDGVNRILLYGSSMGGSTVCYACDRLSLDKKVRAMVIDCAFCSPRVQLEHDAKIRHLPYPLLIPLMRLYARIEQGIDIYSDTSEVLKKTRVPALFVHGTADRTVDFEQCRKNFDACASEKELFAVEGADHIIAYAAGGETAEKKLVSFINKYFD